MAQASQANFDKLAITSQGKYAPVYLIYGHFVREILENESRGKSILYEYKTKKMQ